MIMIQEQKLLTNPIWAGVDEGFIRQQDEINEFFKTTKARHDDLPFYRWDLSDWDSEMLEYYKWSEWGTREALEIDPNWPTEVMFKDNTLGETFVYKYDDSLSISKGKWKKGKEKFYEEIVPVEEKYAIKQAGFKEELVRRDEDVSMENKTRFWDPLKVSDRTKEGMFDTKQLVAFYKEIFGQRYLGKTPIEWVAHKLALAEKCLDEIRLAGGNELKATRLINGGPTKGYELKYGFGKKRSAEIQELAFDAVEDFICW